MAASKPQFETGAVPERRFYVRSRAFGRFGMRIFKPEIMARPHWHGHVEINLIRNARMTYLIDGQRTVVEEGCAVAFWAGVPHQLTEVEQTGGDPAELANLYLPLDVFLFMSHISNIQVALLNGAMIALAPGGIDWTMMQRWYADYRSNDARRTDVMRMELHGVFRRTSLSPLIMCRAAWLDVASERLASVHVRHVVNMIRFIMDNIEKPLRNSDIAGVTGLHENYALGVFSRLMRLPLKQFLIRMRLLRARGLLLESDLAIARVALESGFRSISQFYAHFTAAYGTSPHNLRQGLMPGSQAK